MPEATVTGAPPVAGIFLTVALLAPTQYTKPSRTATSEGSDDIPEASTVAGPPAFETFETEPPGKSTQ